MWKELSDEARSKPSATAFKQHLNSFIRPAGHPIFGIRDKSGIQLLTKIRINFSDLREHRYNHSFNCISPICVCGIEEEPLYITVYFVRVILLIEILSLAKHRI